MKEFLMKNLLKMQLNKLSKDQKEKAKKIIDENPELLIKITEEIQTKIKEGKDQMSAVMETAKKYENELKNIK